MNDVDRVNERDATIAALQVRVRELEKNRDKPIEQVDPRYWDVNELRANVELKARHIDEIQSQLTQRTAERDTARRRVDELEAREVDVVMLREDLEQRTAALERVRSLIKALPKMEGEIRVGKTVDDCWFIDNQDAGGLRGRYKDDGPKYAALLQHRQGMEG